MTDNSNRPSVAIDVNRVVFRYEPAAPEVLHGVSLRILRGEFVAMIGQNGAGKTTLAKMFNGLLKPTSGTVLAGGIDTKQATVGQLAKTVGYVYQNPDHQIFAQRVRAEVAFGPHNLRLSEAETEERVTEALELVGLTDHAEDYAFSLGRGQRQKLAVASVLAMRPPTLVVDEPTTGLDQKGAKGILDLLSRWNGEGRTIVVITHDMSLVAERVPRTVVVAGGEVIADGPTRQVLADQHLLARAFLRPPQVTRVAQRLSHYGVRPDVLTIPELHAELSRLMKGAE